MYHVVMGVAPDDERATEKAEAVVDLPGAVRVTLVHVADGDDSDGDPESVPAVRETVAYLEEHDVGTVTETRLVPESAVERASDALLSVAGEVDADLVVVAGRRRSPAGKLQLSGGSQSVVLNADRPVLVAGDAGDAG